VTTPAVPLQIGKLGKRGVRLDPRTLRIADYLDHTRLPSPPRSTDRRKSNPGLQMWLNNSLGDCTCAAMANAQEVWAALTTAPVTLTDADVLAAYETVGGYIPGEPSTDRGADEISVLNYWRQTGLGGHKIAAYAAVDEHDTRTVLASRWLFDGLYGGYQMPSAAMAQYQAGAPWTLGNSYGQDTAPGSLGGHAMFEIDYDAEYVYLATWGGIQPASHNWIHVYRDELYAVISPDQLTSQGETCEGFNDAQLRADLTAVTT
jgi:hypothetical protein